MLITLMLGTSMAAIDSSIVNVSLPVIRNRFGVNVSSVEWVITAYMIAFCLFIPLTDWLKRKIGYYNLFFYSVAIFTVGSLLCSLSTSLTLLVSARIIQAIGGGAISPTSLAILSENYPVQERGNAIGWWGIGNVMGPAIGPTLGGFLTHYLGWQSIFYVNIPLGILSLLLIRRYLGFLKEQPILHPRFDVRGYIFFSLFIVGLQFTIAHITKNALHSWELWTGLGVSIFSFYAYLSSAKQTDPLLDLSVFKIADFNKAAIIITIRSLALYGGLFFLPFLLQGLMGYSEIQSGLLLLPNALMMLVTRPLAGRLADKGYIKQSSFAGIILVALSFYLFSKLDVGVSIWLIMLPMIVRGLGMSLLVAPVSTALLNSVDKAQTATATSLNSLIQQIGGSAGIAISGVIHGFISAFYLQQGRGQVLSEHFALQDGFLISAFIILLAILPALLLGKKAVAEQKTAENLPSVS